MNNEKDMLRSFLQSQIEEKTRKKSREREEELAIQRKLAEEKRQNQINYSIIGCSILIFVICFIALSRAIITSEKLNAFLAGLAVMMIFKFSSMLLDPYIEFKISDHPAVLFFTAIATASILSPIQKPIKKWPWAKRLLTVFFFLLIL